MSAIKYLLKVAEKLGRKYGSLPIDTDPQDIPQDYQPEGLQDEVLMNYGPTPPVERLLHILKQHGIRGHAFGRGIYVYDGGEKKIIPANLTSVMSYLGY